MSIKPSFEQDCNTQPCDYGLEIHTSANFLWYNFFYSPDWRPEANTGTGANRQVTFTSTKRGVAGNTDGAIRISLQDSPKDTYFFIAIEGPLLPIVNTGIYYFKVNPYGDDQANYEFKIEIPATATPANSLYYSNISENCDTKVSVVYDNAITSVYTNSNLPDLQYQVYSATTVGYKPKDSVMRGDFQIRNCQSSVLSTSNYNPIRVTFKPK